MKRYEFVFCDRATNLDRFDCIISAESEKEAWDMFYTQYSLDDVTNIEVEEFTLQEVAPGVHGWRSTHTALS